MPRHSNTALLHLLQNFIMKWDKMKSRSPQAQRVSFSESFSENFRIEYTTVQDMFRLVEHRVHDSTGYVQVGRA